jgi:hypothetical protein
MRVWPTFLMVVVWVLLLLPASAARASPYWIAYEGNDFPENEGWLRFTGQGGAQRWIEDGALVIDSRADPFICDYYQRRHGGGLDPGPGETFVLQWKITVDEVKVGSSDATIALFSDDKWGVGLSISETQIWSAFEPGVSAPFTPYVAHEFELRSTDMRSYVLTIDGQPTIQGSFWLSLVSSEVSWGDDVVGSSGLAHWDYFRYGVVPEPQTGFLMAFISLFAARAATRTRR